MSIHPAECREVVIHATKTMSCNTLVGILWHKCTDLWTNRIQKPHWFVQAWISWPESFWKLTVNKASEHKGSVMSHLAEYSCTSLHLVEREKNANTLKSYLIFTPFCTKRLHCSSQKIGHKRVMLFTNNDNPHADNPSLQVRIPLILFTWI